MGKSYGVLGVSEGKAVALLADAMMTLTPLIWGSGRSPYCLYDVIILADVNISVGNACELLGKAQSVLNSSEYGLIQASFLSGRPYAKTFKNLWWEIGDPLPVALGPSPSRLGRQLPDADLTVLFRSDISLECRRACITAAAKDIVSETY